MASWNDWKDVEKLEAGLRSLVATNLKDKEILGLVCRIMNGVYEHLIAGFGISKFFVLTEIQQ